MSLEDRQPDGVQLPANDCGCEHVYEHLFVYLDSEMTAADSERVRSHIASCNPCLAELSAEEMVRRMLRRSCVEQAPQHLRDKVLARLQSVECAADSGTDDVVMSGDHGGIDRDGTGLDQAGLGHAGSDRGEAW